MADRNADTPLPAAAPPAAAPGPAAAIRLIPPANPLSMPPTAPIALTAINAPVRYIIP